VETQAFDAIDFARYAGAHWGVVAASVAVATILSAGVGLLLPKRYTATASLIIELPAGSDPRAAAALSPVYLESLRTYEHFASSDTIFREAIEHLGIRSRLPGRPIEALKSSVLRISKPASTRILEISATLNDAVAAQRLAQYLAERTVELNRSLETGSTHDLLSQAEAAVHAASGRLDRANRAREQFSLTNQVEALAAEIENMTELRFDLDRDLQETRSRLADVEARGNPSQGGESENEIAGLRARIPAIERQELTLAAKIRDEAAHLSDLRERREVLDVEQQSARAEAEAARHKLDEIRTSLSYQGERLSILDPGIVPERPSFPNLPLNVVVSLVLAAVGSAFWIACRYGYQRSAVGDASAKERTERVFTLAD